MRKRIQEYNNQKRKNAKPITTPIDEKWRDEIYIIL
jgi:hypothetical protein